MLTVSRWWIAFFPGCTRRFSALLFWCLWVSTEIPKHHSSQSHRRYPTQHEQHATKGRTYKPPQQCQMSETRKCQVFHLTDASLLLSKTCGIHRLAGPFTKSYQLEPHHGFSRMSSPDFFCAAYTWPCSRRVFSLNKHWWHTVTDHYSVVTCW